MTIFCKYLEIGACRPLLDIRINSHAANVPYAGDVTYDANVTYTADVTTNI